MNLQQREAELLATTEADRDEMNENNPIVFAESGPNRFRVMTLFFPDNDGVTIQEDLELNEVTVSYFNNEGQVELGEGALYDWAINYYTDNF
jgi:hypothetical protein